MTKIFEDQAAKLAKAIESVAKANEVYQDAKIEFAALTTGINSLNGVTSTGTAMELFKKWGPKIATYMGLPGGAALVTALSADTGGFGQITGLLGKVFGFDG